MEEQPVLQRSVGDVVIHRIIESERPDFDAAQFFPQITPEQWAPYRKRLAGWAMDPAKNALVLPMQSFVLRTRHHTIVVDTCVGDHKQRARPTWNMTTSGVYLERLAEAGVRPEQVDYVMTTHFHTDHVGWNTRWENGRWVPTFPNARYLMSEKELAYELAHHKETPQNQIADSVIPIIEVGRAQLVKNDFAVTDEVRFESTWGHTPDHMSVRIASRGAEAVITGDLIHSPVQCRELDWVPRPDFDPKQAAATRRAFLERQCERDVLVCASHFPSPSFGRVVREGDGFWFEYARD
jgi:glyoxylase-like metal-dependent hydrolase (beta-lactamase superfamily II)